MEALALDHHRAHPKQTREAAYADVYTADANRESRPFLWS
jgi:hypothetical protein